MWSGAPGAFVPSSVRPILTCNCLFKRCSTLGHFWPRVRRPCHRLAEGSFRAKGTVGVDSASRSWLGAPTCMWVGARQLEASSCIVGWLTQAGHADRVSAGMQTCWWKGHSVPVHWSLPSTWTLGLERSLETPFPTKPANRSQWCLGTCVHSCWSSHGYKAFHRNLQHSVLLWIAIPGLRFPQSLSRPMEGFVSVGWPSSALTFGDAQQGSETEDDPLTSFRKAGFHSVATSLNKRGFRPKRAGAAC